MKFPKLNISQMIVKQKAKKFLPEIKKLKEVSYAQAALLSEIVNVDINFNDRFIDEWCEADSGLPQSGSMLSKFYAGLFKEICQLEKAIQDSNMRDLVGIASLFSNPYSQGDVLESFQTLFNTYSGPWAERGSSIVSPHQDAVLDVLIKRDCEFINHCVKGTFDKIPTDSNEEFRQVAIRAKKLFDVDPTDVVQEYYDLLKGLNEILPSRFDYMKKATPRNIPSLDHLQTEEALQSGLNELKLVLSGRDDWSDAPKLIKEYYQAYTEFPSTFYVVSGDQKEARLLIPAVPLVKSSLDDLIGYDKQKELIIENTERLLNRNHPHHAFLVGENGTGKSSMVNAVIHKYAGEGLRAVNIFGPELNFLPDILMDLKSDPNTSYILIMDDFNGFTDPNSAQAIGKYMEGVYSGFPDNAVMYVSSNDKSVLKPMGFNGETNKSLQHRFGLIVEFPLANYETSFKIFDHHVNGAHERFEQEKLAQLFKDKFGESTETKISPREIYQFASSLQ